MNAGKQFDKALRQAKANANRTGHTYGIHRYGGFWWVERMTPREVEEVNPDDRTIVRPETKEEQ